VRAVDRHILDQRLDEQRVVCGRGLGLFLVRRGSGAIASIVVLGS
jgi:hypothetical protein